jgi:hypothetical protein
MFLAKERAFANSLLRNCNFLALSLSIHARDLRIGELGSPISLRVLATIARAKL